MFIYYDLDNEVFGPAFRQYHYYYYYYYYTVQRVRFPVLVQTDVRFKVQLTRLKDCFSYRYQEFNIQYSSLHRLSHNFLGCPRLPPSSGKKNNSLSTL